VLERERERRERATTLKAPIASLSLSREGELTAYTL
jgi:hypothetical protein